VKLQLGSLLNGFSGTGLRRWCYPSQDLLVTVAIAVDGDFVVDWQRG